MKNKQQKITKGDPKEELNLNFDAKGLVSAWVALAFFYTHKGKQTRTVCQLLTASLRSAP